MGCDEGLFAPFSPKGTSIRSRFCAAAGRRPSKLEERKVPRWEVRGLGTPDGEGQEAPRGA
eukprot:9299335-Lingulodinium_polyedra.AAC.1